MSGINKGYNIGDDVTYSGTVAGALEAALLGIPALAVSLEGAVAYEFGFAAGAAVTVARALLRSPLAGRAFLNVNVPRGPIRGYRTAVQATRNHVTSVSARVDPRGREYYWIDEAEDDWQPHDHSDYQAVIDGYVAVTPLHPDLTAHARAGEGLHWPAVSGGGTVVAWSRGSRWGSTHSLSGRGSAW